MSPTGDDLMAKNAQKKSAFEIETEKQNNRVQHHRDELPGNDDEPELINQYGLALERYHAGAMKNDEATMRDAVARMEACVANLWGCSTPGRQYDGPRERFDCWHSACRFLAAATAAPDGEIPMYGQQGRFLLLIAGCRVDFEYDGVFGICGGDAHVIDLDKPFISETGYRSFQVTPYDKVIWTGGLPVDEYLRRVCENQLLHSGDKKLKEPKLRMVDMTMLGRKEPINRHDWIRENRSDDPAWLPGGYLASLLGMGSAGIPMRMDRSGQFAFAF